MTSVVLAAVAGLTSALAAAAQATPNVVILWADDLGYGDVSSYGATAIQTPHVDRLAREGLRLTDGHSAAATCTPSRYALLTGEYAFRKPGTGVLPGDAALVIEPGRATLASVFQRAGYATAVVGRWHLGLGTAGGPDWNGVIAPGPRELGFGYSFIMPATGDRVPTVYVENGRVVGLDPADPIRVSYKEAIGDWPTGKANPDRLKVHPSHGHDQTIVNGISRIGFMSGGRAALWKDEEMADVFTSQAVRFLEDNRSRPFFLFFSAHDPHVPRVPHPRFAGKTGLGPRGDAIAQFDACVGTIVSALDRLGLGRNTLVLLTSDNDPVADDGYRDDAVARLGGHRPAGPLRGGKYSNFEGGTRVPLIVRFPGRVKAGVSSALVSQVDFVASFAKLLGQPLAPQDASDSENVMPALLGESRSGRETLVEQAGGLSLRQGSWKYIEPNDRPAMNKQTNTELGNAPLPQLYDLARDLGETRNLAAAQPERATRMRELLRQIRDKTTAPATVQKWTRFEAAFTSERTYANAVQEVELLVVFSSPSGRRHRVRGFWDGERSWKVRFSPEERGRWSYRTEAKPSDSGLDAQAGEFECVSSAADNPLYGRGALRVAPSGRHFEHADGTPFFWLADTAWNGPLKADARSWQAYLEDRSAKGFTAVQFVTTQWRAAAANADARPAFYGRERVAIDVEFYRWLDERIDALNARGMVAAPVLLWAVGGATSELNPGNFLPEDQAVLLARYMVARYGAHHVVWFLGGDGDYRGEKAEPWKRIGRAVFDAHSPARPATMHPGGRQWVAAEFAAESWFSFVGYQSGHAARPEDLRWQVEGPPSREWATYAKPVINLEPCYEAHLAGGLGRAFDAFMVRRASYWSVLLAPTAGVSYGAHGIWSWELQPRPPMTHPYTGVAAPWHEALALPGSLGLKHLKTILSSLRWWELRPDPELLVEQPGRDAPERFIAAARAEGGDFAAVYIPEGGEVALRTSRLSRPVAAAWCDPATGSCDEAGATLKNEGTSVVRAPRAGRDWVVLLR